MSTINIVRSDRCLPNEAELDGARKFLFESVDGFSKEDRRAWRSFWKRVKGMEPGEMARVDVAIPRNYEFHKRFFALLNVGFDAWEPARKHKTYKGMPVAKNFERFREDITILAGFYEQTFDLDGNLKLRAKSISFARMGEQEFENLYDSVADVLLQRVLTNYKDRAELDRVIEQLEGFVRS